MTHHLTDDTIIEGIRAATAAWNAPQGTAYYAERFGLSQTTMRAALQRLTAEGRVTSARCVRWDIASYTWTVPEAT